MSTTIAERLRALVAKKILRRDSQQRFAVTSIWWRPFRFETTSVVVADLITNAARHGLRHRGGGIIVALSSPDGAVQCQVTDDGKSLNPKPGRGPRITRALARELGGRLDWHFGATGTTALLRFPRRPHASKLAARARRTPVRNKREKSGVP